MLLKKGVSPWTYSEPYKLGRHCCRTANTHPPAAGHIRGSTGPGTWYHPSPRDRTRTGLRTLCTYWVQAWASAERAREPLSPSNEETVHRVAHAGPGAAAEQTRRLWTPRCSKERLSNLPPMCPWAQGATPPWILSYARCLQLGSPRNRL